MDQKNSRNTKGKIISAAWSLFYDWCICNGEYSLKTYAASAMPIYIGKLLK